MSDGFWKAPIDFVTLIMLLVAGLELGVIGYFDFSPLTWLFGSWHRFVYDAIGLGTIWQISRQRIVG